MATSRNKKFQSELLRTNVKSRHIDRKILVHGACIPVEHPEIFGKFAEGTALSVCLEEEHINKVAWKLASIVRGRGVEELTVLTVDGSPHCVQLHNAAEDVRALFPKLEVRHYVIEKGKVFKVGPEAVRKSRHLSEVESLLKG